MFWKVMAVAWTIILIVGMSLAVAHRWRLGPCPASAQPRRNTLPPAGQMGPAETRPTAEADSCPADTREPAPVAAPPQAQARAILANLSAAQREMAVQGLHLAALADKIAKGPYPDLIESGSGNLLRMLSIRPVGTPDAGLVALDVRGCRDAKEAAVVAEAAGSILAEFLTYEKEERLRTLLAACTEELTNLQTQADQIRKDLAPLTDSLPGSGRTAALTAGLDVFARAVAQAQIDQKPAEKEKEGLARLQAEARDLTIAQARYAGLEDLLSRVNAQIQHVETRRLDLTLSLKDPKPRVVGVIEKDPDPGVTSK